MTLVPHANDPERPLVSVLIYNYNYGRYLRACFDSVLAQSYDNIEINFSDNASTDDSWNIALEYQRRYPEVFFVARNRRNFGADANVDNVWSNAHGKYLMLLCSDDALLPEYVRTCVEALEARPEAGFAMVHRAILDEDGVLHDEPPFYNQTCLIPGPGQAAVYMMAAVNPAVSQIMYRKQLTEHKGVHGGLAARWYGTRILDFNMCCEFPMIYIKEALLQHRLHDGNDSFRAAENLMEVIGPYVLNHQFAETARCYGHDHVSGRLPASIEKVARLALRYSVRALLGGKERAARRYFHLAVAFWPEIDGNEVFGKIERYWHAGTNERQTLLAGLADESNLVTRAISYDPPLGSVPLSLTDQGLSAK